jgi:hypothetical protein
MDCCLVDIDVDSGEGDGCVWVNFPTARKFHVCGECGEHIKPGQKYEHVRGQTDGRFSTCKTCLVCHELRERFCCGFYYEYVLSDIYQGLIDNRNRITLGMVDDLSMEGATVISNMLDEIWSDYDE